ncbi:alanine racemase [Marinilactibacillus sp. GCM10026970]|uniref:alanine racemase n=1 Tax=Marinilactibacillus sp. GCM10026970 TaxID=3252642 RepID=UPI003621F3B8
MSATLTFNQQRLFKQARSLQEKQNLIVVVKNNAYNFGMERAYKVFYKAGIRSYATTNLEEAVWLRKQDDQITVLLLDPSTEFDVLREHDISLTLPNVAFYHQYKEHLEGIKIHLVFKNLLNRFGFDTAEEMKAIFDDQFLTITGIWTHFAFADELSDERYEIEKENWSNVLTVLEPYLDTLTFIHAQNSASYLREGLFDQHTHIRAGAIAYGARPYYDLPESLASQTIEVSASVKEVVFVPKGQSAGYSAAFVAEEDTLLAICDIGYGNGILRTRSKHEVIINHKSFPIAVLMMSHLMVKVDASVTIGNRVYLYNDALKLDDFAHKGVGAFSEQMATLNHQTFKINDIPLSE